MRLGKLENLYLRGNQLNISILSILSGLSSLKSLDLSGKSADRISTPTDEAGKVRDLDLSNNRLNSRILSILSGLSSLKSLDLSENMLTESGFEIKSSHLGKLENLDLSHNNIFNDNILSHLRGLSSLKSLDLSYNMLLGSMTVNGTFFNSSTLEELYLDNTFSPNKLSSGHWSIACSSSIVCW
ncbi:uncharacterized protein [Populus alba]|uniref:uncharacterized protein n=1 Tax=Populus alba TaxID=43335 RepID=UPI003CC774A3